MINKIKSFQQKIYQKKSFVYWDDCRNQWLINQEKENQVINAFYKRNPIKQLFDSEIAIKLKAKIF